MSSSLPAALATTQRTAGCAWLLTLAVIGCGSPAAPPPPAAEQSVPKKTAAAPASGETPATESANRNVRTDATGRKWIGDIPFDVFFDDPLAVVANTAAVTPAAQPAATSPTAAMPASPPAAPAATPTAPAAPAAPAAGDGSVNWPSLISMDQITDETKRIRNHLTASLQSQGTYNGAYKELQIDGAVVAALAELVHRHPESVTWKENARFVREYGSQLNKSATALGRQAYTTSQTAAEGIAAVLNGNLPADAGDPAPTQPFGEVADRAGVMKRIEKASEWMRANIDSEAVFKQEQAQIQMESAMIAALGQVISDTSYDSADEPDYAGFAKNLVEGANAAKAAAQAGSYPDFSDAMNRVQKACAECHASYGNG